MKYWIFFIFLKTYIQADQLCRFHSWVIICCSLDSRTVKYLTYKKYTWSSLRPCGDRWMEVGDHRGGVEEADTGVELSKQLKKADVVFITG